MDGKLGFETFLVMDYFFYLVLFKVRVRGFREFFFRGVGE